jgi:hypothetical protein
MGANATTFVPTYVASEILTAADLNVTNSGIPVFATTVTRDAAFGGTGEKTLAEGQFAYIEATKTTQYYDGAAWQSVGVSPGLVLVKTQTIGSAVASVAVTDAFSATYENYLITVSGGTTSSGGTNLELTFGATATGYYSQLIYATWGNTPLAAGASNTTRFTYAGGGYSGGLSMSCYVGSPNLAKTTSVGSAVMADGFGGNFNGTLQDSTQYTGFTITSSNGTLTGGTIYVYGYAKA